MQMVKEAQRWDASSQLLPARQYCAKLHVQEVGFKADTAGFKSKFFPFHSGKLTCCFRIAVWPMLGIVNCL